MAEQVECNKRGKVKMHLDVMHGKIWSEVRGNRWM